MQRIPTLSASLVSSLVFPVMLLQVSCAAPPSPPPASKYSPPATPSPKRQPPRNQPVVKPRKDGDAHVVPAKPSVALNSHMSASWLDGATMIDTLKGAAYYRGTIDSTSPQHRPWTGTIQGDIFYVSNEKAVVIPSGSLTIGPNETMKIVGAHEMFVLQPGQYGVWLSLPGFQSLD